MGFTKEKTIIVSAKDFLARDAICHAEFESGGQHYLVQVVRDMDVGNPREEFDHAWTWATTRGAGYSDKHAMSLDEWRGMEKAERARYLSYPLRLLRHSGDTVYVGSGEHWADPGGWDSGQMGVAYITKERVLSEWGAVWKDGKVVNKAKRLTRAIVEKAYKSLKTEVAEMNLFLQGDVYGVMLTCLETEDCDSCWGFYCGAKEEICRAVTELLPAGMAAEEERAVIEALEWA